LAKSKVVAKVIGIHGNKKATNKNWYIQKPSQRFLYHALFKKD
jgi:hypothetical protein